MYRGNGVFRLRGHTRHVIVYGYNRTFVYSLLQVCCYMIFLFISLYIEGMYCTKFDL
ncbi:hypothetical protein HanRHA438_Chr06g0276841 [Helianthus annuus]|nr:hypothetical protein HanRHA438_Chr06g0276841 [Helianthus annuus]